MTTVRVPARPRLDQADPQPVHGYQSALERFARLQALDGEEVNPVCRSRLLAHNTRTERAVTDLCAALMLDGTHGGNLLSAHTPRSPRSPRSSARSRTPMRRAELAMMGIDESSWSSAPVTGERNRESPAPQRV